jgi:hypothetical protein
MALRCGWISPEEEAADRAAWEQRRRTSGSGISSPEGSNPSKKVVIRLVPARFRRRISVDPDWYFVQAATL